MITDNRFGISDGIRFSFYALLFFSLMNICIKKIPHIPAIEIVFFRTIISFFVTLFALKLKSIPVFGTHKKILLLRGFLGTIALVLFFHTIQIAPLATAVLLVNLSPIFTALLAVIFLNEKLRKIQLLFWMISILGIILIYQLDGRIPLTTLIMGVMGAVLAGAAYNCIRKLRNLEHPLVIIFYFPLVAFPISLLFSLFQWVTPEKTDWLYLIAIGLLTQIAQYFLTKAYQIEKAEKVANTSYLSNIFALVYGYLFFGERYDFIVIFGMILVILGIVLNLNYKKQA